MVQVLQAVDVDKEHKVREIDKDCKCKFSFKWLDKEVETKLENGQSTTQRLGDFIEKTYTAGQAICTLCNDTTLHYAGRGVSSLTDHCKIKKHVKNVQARLKTHAINHHFVSATPKEHPIAVGAARVDNTTTIEKPTLTLPALMCSLACTISFWPELFLKYRPKIGLYNFILAGTFSQVQAKLAGTY
jgi:hypothetical protein